MKTVKQKVLVLVVVLGLIMASVAWSTTDRMPQDAGLAVIPVFTPSEIVVVAAAGDVTVSAYKVISFDNDATIYLNQNSTKTYLWPASRPLGVAAGVTTIHVDAAVNMAVMQ